MAKIVLNPFGSFGDLHPYLAIAIELARRGHKPLIATSEVYRAKVQAEGIDFTPVRPDVEELLGQAELLKKLWDPKHGTEFLLRDYLLPRVEEAYEDLSPACTGADLLVTHTVAYAGPIVAEARKLRWISVALQPAVLFSTYDPSVAAEAPWMRHLYGLGRWAYAGMLKVADLKTTRWARPASQLRQKLALPIDKNPVIEGQYSPCGTLALFSPLFAAPQPDWPVNTQATGFLNYDKRGEGFGPSSSKTELDRFLDAGPAPVVFTLGSSAVMAAGQFFAESIKAAKKLGLRAVVLVGKTEQPPKADDSSIYISDYAPYSELLPRAAATVHQGGIGTVAQALRAGRPMMIVPWAHDQPDNAERCRRLGVSRTVWRSAYRSEKIARELDRLLNDRSYENNARTIASRLANEDGLKAACDVLEASVSSEPTVAR